MNRRNDSKPALPDPEKRWKWNSGDLEERKLWDEYMKAFEDVISATSTKCAPWYVVPSNRKWYRNLVVADRVVDALEGMHLKTPPAPGGVDFAKLTIVLRSLPFSSEAVPCRF